VGANARRLRGHGYDPRRAPTRAAAPLAAGRGRHQHRPGDATPRLACTGRRSRRRAPAPGDGQGHRVHAARGSSPHRCTSATA
jgi:hypothetical protein